MGALHRWMLSVLDNCLCSGVIMVNTSKGKPPKKMSEAESIAQSALDSAVIRGYSKETIDELRNQRDEIRRLEGLPTD